CAFAATTTTDDAEAARYADLACRGGVIARGGCFDISLSAHGSPVARAALDHACKSGSADGCDLLGRFAFERGELDAAKVALARACELAPGSDGCTALEVLERTGTVDPE
ncbi:MAG: hypothetical protein H0T89_07680, partial [Deltaproteobacteria bacterium]|nr:hypothetical protein [Deltaproteobacteria bacterium]